MRTTYQRAFDHVTASDHLKKEVLEMTKQEQDILRRRIPRAVLIAAVLILVLAGTAVAVSVPGIQDWFRQYWQETAGDTAMPAEQEEAIGQMTQSVGTSAGTKAPETEPATANAGPAGEAEKPGESEKTAPDHTDVPEAILGGEPSQTTVTLESVTVGEKHLWLLLHVSGNFEPGKTYTFARAELIGAPEKVYSDLGIKVGKGLTYRADGCKILEDGSLQIMAQYQSPDPNADLTAGGEFCLHLETLLMEREPLLEGQWEIPFTLEQGTLASSIKLENILLPVSGLEGASDVTFQEMRVFSTGMELICDAEYAGFTLWTDVALILADGSEIPNSAAHASWEGEAEKSRWVADYTWKVPVALEQAAAVRIGGQVIPLS